MSKVITFPKAKTEPHGLPASATVVMIETSDTNTVILDLDVLYDAMNKDIPLEAVPPEMMVLALTMCYQTVIGQLALQGLIKK